MKKIRFISFILIIILVVFWGKVEAKRDVINLKGKEAEKTVVELQNHLTAHPEDYNAMKDLGIILHQISRKNPTKKNIEKAIDLLTKVSKNDKNDFETKGWLGSVITMRALLTDDPGKKTFYVKLGTRKIDKAIAKEPDNLVLRLIRGGNSLELPLFLKRIHFAVIDFEYAKKLCAEKIICTTKQKEDITANLKIAIELNDKSS